VRFVAKLTLLHAAAFDLRGDISVAGRAVRVPRVGQRNMRVFVAGQAEAHSGGTRILQNPTMAGPTRSIRITYLEVVRCVAQLARRM